MPKLVGLAEYRFVKPNVGSDGRPSYVHPSGWKFTTITGPRVLELAERMDALVVHYTDLVERCANEKHAKCGEQREGEWLCKRWLRLSKEATRTKERTMCIRVEIPI